MSKTKISQYSAVASDNTDVNGININEGCPPSSMNNMGREIMAALKRYQVGSDGDGVTVGGNLVVSGTATVTSGSINGTTVGATTPATGSFTTLNTSGQVVFNDAGANVDFRVEGDAEPNLLFVDASADAVGIGTNAPVIGGARSYSRVLTIDGGTNTGIEDTGALELGSSTDTNDRLVGSLAFFNRDNSGSTGETRRQVAIIEAKCATSDSNAGNDSGGNLVFLTKTEASFVSERMRLTSDGFLRMASGSGGIQFNGDTAAANALDDYEEGTWTPASSSGTLSFVRAGYRKIGSQVTVCAVVSNFSDRVSANGVVITGAPFSGNASFRDVAAGSAMWQHSDRNGGTVYINNSSGFEFYAGTTSSNFTAVIHSSLNSVSAEAFFVATYIAAS